MFFNIFTSNSVNIVRATNIDIFEMRKIKVLFINDMLIPDLDGATRTMFQLINRIPTDKFDFLFLCGKGPEKIRDFKCIHVPTIKIPGNNSYSIATPINKFELDAQVEEFSPDIVHISSPTFIGNYGIKTAKRLNIPIISIYHTHYISYTDYYFKDFSIIADITKNTAKIKTKEFYEQCDIVYIPSMMIINELAEIGIRKEKLKLWQRGIDHNIFSPSKKDPELLHSITGNYNPCILFASRLVWEKNLQCLIDLFALIKEKQLPYNLIVAGEGTAKEQIQGQLAGAYFLGHVDHKKLAALYASAQVFFFPSITETFGNVVLEAMASGIPCVIADEGGSSEFIQQGENGYLCQATNANEFLSRISEIIEHPELVQKFSEQGVKTSEKYIWENLATEYFREIESLSIKNHVV